MYSSLAWYETHALLKPAHKVTLGLGRRRRGGRSTRFPSSLFQLGKVSSAVPCLLCLSGVNCCCWLAKNPERMRHAHWRGSIQSSEVIQHARAAASRTWVAQSSSPTRSNTCVFRAFRPLFLFLFPSSVQHRSLIHNHQHRVRSLPVFSWVSLSWC